MIMKKNKDLCTSGSPGPQPGARHGEQACKVAPGGRAFFCGVQLGSVQKQIWVCPHVGSPAEGGAREVRCYVDQVAVKDRGLGGAIPGC